MQKTAALWRLRAQQTRDLVELMSSPVTRDNLEKVANEYDIVARQIDERTARPDALEPKRL
jgi:hypothetical protein